MSSHRDPTQFKDPDCFNPTNFLDDKGEFQSKDAFMPFAPGMGQEGRGQAWAASPSPPAARFTSSIPIPVSSGKRMCLGAGLARSEIFLFLTTILQRFCLLPAGSPGGIDLTPRYTGLGNIPPVFQLRLVAR